MKQRLAPLVILPLFAFFIASAPAPVRAQTAPDRQQHEQHHAAPSTQQGTPAPAQPQANAMDMMSRMQRSTARLDELVKMMNAATGAAKTDAMAQLLTALIEDRRNMCEPMMANMMSMMGKMDGRGGHVETASPGK